MGPTFVHFKLASLISSVQRVQAADMANPAPRPVLQIGIVKQVLLLVLTFNLKYYNMDEFFRFLNNFICFYCVVSSKSIIPSAWSTRQQCHCTALCSMDTVTTHTLTQPTMAWHCNWHCQWQ